MEYYHLIPQILLSVALISVGIVLYLLVRKVIEQMNIFRGYRAGVTAFSVACLVTASIAMLLFVPNSTANNGNYRLSVNFTLLPSVAVALATNLLLLFVIASSTAPGQTDEISSEKTAEKSAEAKSPGRPKKKESKLPLFPQKSGGKGKGQTKASTATDEAVTT